MTTVQEWIDAGRPMAGPYPVGYPFDPPPPEPSFEMPSFSMPHFDYPSYDYRNLNKIDSGSIRYGWEPQTTQDVGLSIPIAIGQEKLFGNMINMFTSNSGDKHYLNVLIALCEGEIEEITSVKINGNPIANYSGVTTYERMGTNSQSLINNFHDLHNLYSVNQIISAGESTTYTTSETDVEAFEINFNCPYGLYERDSSNGSLKNHPLSMKVEYRVYGSGSAWTSVTKTVTRKQQSAVRFIKRVEGLAANRYDIKITNLNGADTAWTESTVIFVSVDEMQTDDLIYPNIALWGCKLLATEQLSGGMPNFEFTGKWLLCSIPKIMYSGAEVDWADYYWDSATEEWKRFSDDAVCTWDDVTWVTRWNRNPIWHVKNIQLNARYGLGDKIDSTDINDSNYLEKAKHCEEKVPDGDGGYEKRFELDVVIDSPTRALDLLSQLAIVFRGYPYQSAGKINFHIDQAGTPTYLFGMNNIVHDSFSQSWKSKRELPNVIEVTFNDEDKDYEAETIQFGEVSSGEAKRGQEVRVFTTKMSQAIREGRYIKNVADNITKSITFRAGIDALRCNVGDIVYVSHDVPQWGFSGRVESSSTVDLVKLDQSITVEAGHTYKILIQFADDTIEEKTVSDGAGTYTEVNVSSSFSQAPAAYDKYVYHDEDIPLKQFRITNLRREMKNEISVSAKEYSADVYDDTAVTLPTTNYSALDHSLPDVSDLTLSERVQKLKDGTIEDVIDVSFQKPVQTDYQLNKFDHVKIFLKEGSSGEWVPQGICYGEKFPIMGGIQDGLTYYVAVVTVSSDNSENHIDDSPSDSITVEGKSAKPTAPTGFDVVQLGSNLKFNVDKHPEADFAKFKVTKANGTVVVEEADLTEIYFPVGEIGPVTFYCYAKDTSDGYSEIPAIDTIIITTPPDMNFINDYDFFSNSFEYSLSGCAVEMRNDYDASYVRPVLCLASAETWEEWEATGGDWEDDETNIFCELGEGPFEPTGSFTQVEPFDLTAIFESKIIIDADYKNVDYGSVAVYVSYSTDGFNYTSFELLNANSTYRARYIKFRVVLSTSDTAYNIYLYAMSILIVAPVALVDWIRDLAVPSDGIRVDFGKAFTFPPGVRANIINGIGGFLSIYDKTISGVSFRIYSDFAKTTPISGAEIDGEFKGY